RPARPRKGRCSLAVAADRMRPLARPATERRAATFVATPLSCDPRAPSATRSLRQRGGSGQFPRSRFVADSALEGTGLNPRSRGAVSPFRVIVFQHPGWTPPINRLKTLTSLFNLPSEGSQSAPIGDPAYRAILQST